MRLQSIPPIFAALLPFSTLVSVTSRATGSDLLVKRTCGSVNVPSNKNGCNGINAPTASAGVCTAGNGIVGCPCANICGATNGKCNENGCDGINDFKGGPGICTGGTIVGCFCDSVCGEPGPCNENDCARKNEPGADLGKCTTSRFKGCSCKSVYGNFDGACDKNGCNGVGGFCTAGDVDGCSCGSNCGNLLADPCGSNGCNGTFDSVVGFGVCVGGFLVGCICSS